MSEYSRELREPIEVKPRKRHQCEWCGEAIEKGERCISRSYIFDGEIQSEWQHVECYAACSEVLSSSTGPIDWMPGEFKRGTSEER